MNKFLRWRKKAPDSGVIEEFIVTDGSMLVFYLIFYFNFGNTFLMLSGSGHKQKQHKE